MYSFLVLILLCRFSYMSVGGPGGSVVQYLLLT